MSNAFLQCFDNKGFYIVDLSLDPLTAHHTSLQSIVEISNLNMEEVMVVRTLTNTYVYRVSLSEPPAVLLKLEKVNVLGYFKMR